MNKANNAYKLSGALLAGGKSLRMGQDKGLIHLHGMTMAERITMEMRLVCDEVFIIANNDEYYSTPYRVYKDIIENKGPAGGILTAFEYAKYENILITGCDMPNLNHELFIYLANQINDESEAIVPVFQNDPQPLCAIYNKRCKNVFENDIRSSHLKMHDIIKQLKTSYLTIDTGVGFFKPDVFYNINSPDDLKKIQHED